MEPSSDAISPDSHRKIVPDIIADQYIFWKKEEEEKRNVRNILKWTPKVRHISSPNVEFRGKEKGDLKKGVVSHQWEGFSH